jgi:hypothetical protein
MEDVGDDLQVIEHNPLAGRKSINRCRPNGVIFPKARLNFVRDRLELRFGAARADHEEIGEGGNFTQVDDDDVFRLFVGGELCAKYR